MSTPEITCADAYSGVEKAFDKLRTSPRVVLNGISFEDGASIEALDDRLAWLRSHGGSRENIVRTYLGLRKARAIDRHSPLAGAYAKSGVPCRRANKGN